MATPTAIDIQQSLTRLQTGLPLPQKDIYNISWGFSFQPNQDQFLLEVNALNKKLAETLLVFRKRLSDAAANQAADLVAVIDQVFLHYVVNTDGQILEGEADDPFDVFEAATRYAASLNIGVSKGEDGSSILNVDGKAVPCPEWGVLPGWSAAWSLRRVGPVINKARYGREDVIPSFVFGFDEQAEDHRLENAMTLADFSHLAYFGPQYIEMQLKQWGYDTFRWIEDKETDTQVFVAGRGDHLIVSFRGTSSGKDALVDLNFLKTDAFGGRGRVHRGFNGALNGVWDNLLATANSLGRDKKMFICGHSLGAALAQLAAHRFALESFNVANVYVYGSPRVGNRAFKEAYNELLEAKTFLHINHEDIVTQIPLQLLGFHHLGGPPRVFDRGHHINSISAPQPAPAKEEQEMTFDMLDNEKQEDIKRQMREVRTSIAASTLFLTTDPSQLSAGNYSTNFDSGAVDDHSMDQYLFKFGCAILDREWERLQTST
ncbi:MAG: lipase family protein [Saprospiraceae bacterium]